MRLSKKLNQKAISINEKYNSMPKTNIAGLLSKLTSSKIPKTVKAAEKRLAVLKAEREKLQLEIESVSVSRILSTNAKKKKLEKKFKEKYNPLLEQIEETTEIKDSLENDAKKKEDSKTSLFGFSVESEYTSKDFSELEEEFKKSDNISVVKENFEEHADDAARAASADKSTDDSIDKESFKKINNDILNIPRIIDTNSQISKFLEKTNPDMAKQISDNTSYLVNEIKNKPKEDVTNILKEVNNNNEKIIEVLQKINADMIDEQDTSIKQKEQKQEQVVINNITNTEKEESSFNLLEMLSGVFGSAFMALFAKSKILKDLIFNLLKAGGVNLGALLDLIKKFSFTAPKTPKASNKPDISKTKAQKATKVSDVNKVDKESKKYENRRTKRAQAKAEAKSVKASKAAKTANVKPDVKASKGSGIVKKLTKFAKPIPLIGTALAVGTAIYSAADGYNNAEEIFDIPKNKITNEHRLASAAGSVLNDFSLGFVSEKAVAEKIIDWTTNKDDSNTIRRFDLQRKIIDHDYIGNSEILDWVRLEKLPSEDIQSIIDLDDWSDDDRKRLEEIKKNVLQREKAKYTEMYNKQQAISVSASSSLSASNASNASNTVDFDSPNEQSNENQKKAANSNVLSKNDMLNEKSKKEQVVINNNKSLINNEKQYISNNYVHTVQTSNAPSSKETSRALHAFE